MGQISVSGQSDTGTRGLEEISGPHPYSELEVTEMIRISCGESLFKKKAAEHNISGSDVSQEKDGTLVPHTLSGQLFLSLFIVEQGLCGFGSNSSSTTD